MRGWECWWDGLDARGRRRRRWCVNLVCLNVVCEILMVWLFKYEWDWCWIMCWCLRCMWCCVRFTCSRVRSRLSRFGRRDRDLWRRDDFEWSIWVFWKCLLLMRRRKKRVLWCVLLGWDVGWGVRALSRGRLDALGRGVRRFKLCFWEINLRCNSLFWVWCWFYLWKCMGWFLYILCLCLKVNYESDMWFEWVSRCTFSGSVNRWVRWFLVRRRRFMICIVFFVFCIMLFKIVCFCLLVVWYFFIFLVSVCVRVNLWWCWVFVICRFFYLAFWRVFVTSVEVLVLMCCDV